MPYAGESWGGLVSWGFNETLNHWHLEEPSQSSFGHCIHFLPSPRNLPDVFCQKFILIAAHLQSFHSEESVAGLKCILLILTLTLILLVLNLSPILNPAATAVAVLLPALLPASAYFPKMLLWDDLWNEWDIKALLAAFPFPDKPFLLLDALNL